MVPSVLILLTVARHALTICNLISPQMHTRGRIGAYVLSSALYGADYLMSKKQTTELYYEIEAARIVLVFVKK